MICQPNDLIMLQMLEKLSAQAIHRNRSDGPTVISNTGVFVNYIFSKNKSVSCEIMKPPIGWIHWISKWQTVKH